MPSGGFPTQPDNGPASVRHRCALGMLPVADWRERRVRSKSELRLQTAPIPDSVMRHALRWAFVLRRCRRVPCTPYGSGVKWR